MVAADGGIFAFNVPFEGSMPSVRALTGAPFVLTVRMRALPSGMGYYLLAADGSVYSFGTAKNFGSAPGINAVDLMLAPVGGDHFRLPRALGPAPATAPDRQPVEMVDDRLGVVAEPHERDAEHGPGAAAAAHAVHRDPDALLDVRDDVGGRRVHELALAIGIARRVAAHEILQAHRGDRARRRVVGRLVVGQAHDVPDALAGEQHPVGAARIGHARERDGGAAHPVEVVGHAQRAEEAGVRAGRQQPHRHAPRRHGDREPRAEPIAGRDERRGAAAERVDRRGHRLDRGERTLGRYVELRERIGRAESELDAAPAGGRARSGGRAPSA